MPWRETSPMDQRTQFIADHLRETLSRSRSCATGTASPARRATSGSTATCATGRPASRIARAGPHRAPNQTRRGDRRTRSWRRAIGIPRWGGKKLLALLQRAPSAVDAARALDGVRHPEAPRPGAHAAARAAASAIPASPRARSWRPNDVWCADYKGQFRTGDGRYCYPLTVTDGFSRYLLGCQGLQLHGGRGGQARLHAAVQGVRPAAAHPHRQRRALRHHHPGAALEALGLVGAPGHPARAHRARPPRAERPA